MVQKRTDQATGGLNAPEDPSWDDLRLLLAVGRAGSLRKAAGQLGLGHATLSRRLGRLEQQLGVRLFDRPSAGAVVLTPAGEELAGSAALMDDTAATALRRVAGRDLALTGTLRVSVNPLIGIHLLPPVFDAFSRAYPDVCLEVMADYVSVNLDRREADVVVRVTDTPPDNLVGQRFGPVGYGFYAGRAAVEAAGGVEAYLAGQPPLLGYTGRRDNAVHVPWLRAELPGSQASLTAGDPLQIAALVRAGAGIARLPSVLGAVDEGFVRLFPDQREEAYAVWLLTHADLRKTARVRAFMDHMAAALKARLPVITGLPES
ncbi:LysR family transcriptional regulator [Pyruvatibacter mobilis]|uniref:LysR family transcriptional regulator n=1 Tax=Pyruvatibacter mobilis TaxID=1712261 RepID=A0A845Q768_9HYPH|nr:LysR family transcriptional regulator [Pyruvatibacter mobilis]NBG94174.1 LysR family transcriptional regulator [Pyruvatibacter mobilis]QJD76483.1 LysR family transcriptional regulator [Pyruvatibacter mobilis]GGD00960.1 LysR family transcriptional regulator [Pyruvatibacter mobilis]